MHWRYLTLILSVLLAAALTVGVAAAVFGGDGAGLPAWALAAVLAIALLLRRVAR
ncbi:hypothetical protein [Albidovulum sediminis]|uniref:CTP synthetase n=1 Tax=Albidovulum sediminis TaxID=3066345 RepID=A0ABT2NJG1_9RHOB|nr:hypothetical protein [Defluviimonas sediminis]MCT8329061.1 hypothetical protein [Defluviimonas sediminis]